LTRAFLSVKEIIDVRLVRPPGFEPGSSAWQADILTRLDYGRSQSTYRFQGDINLLPRNPSGSLKNFDNVYLFHARC
jgi:hypothetical protein